MEKGANAWTVLTDDRGTVAGVVDWYLPGPGWEQLYYNTTGLCRSFKGAFLGGGENLRTDDPDYNLGRSYWTPFGYLGMYRDRFTGLYHTHFREYDAVHGRWLSEDPAGYADGLNLYQAYMGVNGTDPLGLLEAPQWMQENLAESSRYWNCLTELAELEEKIATLEAQAKKLEGTGLNRLVGGPIARDYRDKMIFPLVAQKKMVYKKIADLIAEQEYGHLIEAGISPERAVVMRELGDFGVKNVYEAITGGDIYGSELTSAERFGRFAMGSAELVTFAVPAAKGIVAAGEKAGTKLAGSKLIQQARNLVRPKPVVAPVSQVPAPLKAGIPYETSRLAELGIVEKNTAVWRPTVADVDSAAFKVIVGDAKYTQTGLLKGTIFDATQGGLLEIKSGTSVLDSSYQLRLQTFHSLKKGIPLIIDSTRPINPTFRAWLERWGVTVNAPI